MNLNKIDKLLYGYFVFTLISLAWFFYPTFIDEEAAAGRTDFYKNTQPITPDRENISTALAGISAPVGKDIFAHGKQTQVLTLENFKSKNVANTKLSNEIEFVGNTEQLECWQLTVEKETPQNCMSANELKRVLQGNQILLDRYISILDLHHWQGMDGRLQQAININRLIAAKIKLDAVEGKTEQAFDLWQKNQIFINRVLAQEQTMAARAIFLVLDVISLDTLDTLLAISPDFAKSKRGKIANTFPQIGLKRYNLKGMLKAEYRLFEYMPGRGQAVYIHPEFIKNKIYRANLEWLECANLDGNSFDGCMHTLNLRYASFIPKKLNEWRDPLNNIFANMLISGQVRALELVKSMREHNAKIQMALTKINAQTTR